MKLSNVEPPRPLTHDLLSSVIKAFNGKIHRVMIDKMENNTFHAKIELKTRNGRKMIVDARPSDSIALAVRSHADIFVAEDVIEKAAIFNAE